MSDEKQHQEQDDAIIGHALRWSLIAVLVIVLGAGAVWLLTREQAPQEEILERGAIEAPAELETERAERPSIPFADVTAQWGIDFVHDSGAKGEKLLPETMGGGVAVFDLDGDGDEDLCFVSSGGLASDSPAVALYRNEGGGRFANVTEGYGLAGLRAIGMGVATGDADGDGDIDLFVSALGPNLLLVNEGGRFREAAESAGLSGGDADWSTSSGFFDADGDGDLDLFVANYVAWSRELDLQLNFTLNGRDRAYGPPVQYPGAHCRLYRNDGGLKFTDVTEEAGIAVRNPATGEPLGKALAISFADIGNDGLLDVFVANDTVQNFLFKNLGGGRFEEVGARSGVAFDEAGMATGAMGLDLSEPAGDGRLAVGIGNFANESSSLYLQQRGDWRFADLASAVGVGSPSRLRLSFGLFFADLDLDGREDLLQANGHLEDEIAEVQPSQTYHQPAQLFWNCSEGTRPCFVPVPEDETGDLGRPLVGRGAAYGDLDGDGDLDVVLTQPGGPPAVLRNDQATGHRWLRVRLVGAPPNSSAIGASVELVAAGRTQRRRVVPARSYLASVESPVTFGLGRADSVESLTVRWPDGFEQRVEVPGLDRELVVRR